jgi:hypothetical protein
MVTFSPEEDEPFPDGGRRARAAEVKEELVVVAMVVGRRMGLEAREAVLEMNARLGLVRDTNPAGWRRIFARGKGRREF